VGGGTFLLRLVASPLQRTATVNKKRSRGSERTCFRFSTLIHRPLGHSFGLSATSNVRISAILSLLHWAAADFALKLEISILWANVLQIFLIVTRSRLHAVRFKLAVDEYLKQKGYAFKSLVAFSGTVRDKGADLTESGMNTASTDAAFFVFRFSAPSVF